MSGLTARYAFVLPDPLENYDIAVQNANFTAVDAAIGARADAITEIKAKHFCLLRPTAAQSIPDTTATVMDFNSNVGPSQGVTVDLAANNVTIVKGGLYVISAAATFVAAAGGIRMLVIIKNGSSIAANAFAGFTGGFNIPAASIVTPLDLGDVITVGLTQTSGGALNTGPVDRSFLSLSRIGDYL